MAGLGKKTFAAGEVLRAADVNGYLMDQSVMNFAGTAARGSAVASPSEGMVSYRADSDFIEIYSGSSWLPAVSSTAWTAYTPTFSGFTLGNGSVAFYYKQVGKTVFVNGNLTFGSTSSMPGPFDFTMPTSLNSRQASGLLPTGRAYYYNNSALYSGSILFIGGNSVRSIADTVSGTRIINNEITSTVPFTWANTHTYKFSLVYEAA